MSAPECVITGCALVDMQTNCWCWGDLHRIGEAFVFNAVLEGFKADWSYTPTEHIVETRRAVIVAGGIFERRGVIVFAVADAMLNDVARDYLKERP